VNRATQTRDNAIELGTIPRLLRRKVAEAGPEFAARQRNSLIGGQEQPLSQSSSPRLVSACPTLPWMNQLSSRPSSPGVNRISPSAIAPSPKPAPGTY
jgi:hypothetical protein